MNHFNAMLMTAGLGTRLRPFSDRLPKPALPLMGVRVAQYAVDALVEAGVSRIVANVHHHPELLRSALLGLERGAAEIVFSDETPELLGSAGGVRKALPLLGDQPFLLMNADTVCDVDIRALYFHHLKLREQWGVQVTLALNSAEADQASGKGEYREVLLDANGERVLSFGERVKNRPFFSGVAVCEPSAFAQLEFGKPADTLTEVFQPLARTGQLGASVERGLWYDVGSPELWRQAHLELIRQLEAGTLSRRIRERIESSNTRIAEQIWSSRGGFSRASSAPIEWRGPVYYSSAEPWLNAGRGGIAMSPPARLGPGAVVYAAPGVQTPADRGGAGIAYGDLWSPANF